MALPILDGNQTATTLATTVSGSAHYPNHIIASGTVTANVDVTSNIAPGISDYANNYAPFPVAVQYGNLDFVAGIRDGDGSTFGVDRTFPVTISDPLPAGGNLIGQVQLYGTTPVIISTGTARIGVVTVGAGTVTIGAGTAQIGSVTASISGTVPISISSVTIANSSVTVNGTFYQATQPVSLTTLPALVAGTAQIGSVTASISNSVVTFYPLQGTSVSNTNFTSLTSSTSLVSAVANREVLTVFNEGAGNLHISAGATCTTISYQVRLSAGDYWECPQGQLSLAHTAVFATAGTARVSQIS